MTPNNDKKTVPLRFHLYYYNEDSSVKLLSCKDFFNKKRDHITNFVKYLPVCKVKMESYRVSVYHFLLVMLYIFSCV